MQVSHDLKWDKWNVLITIYKNDSCSFINPVYYIEKFFGIKHLYWWKFVFIWKCLDL